MKEILYLEEMISRPQTEKGQFKAELETETANGDVISNFEGFYSVVRKEKKADKDFKARRQIIELPDIAV